MSYITVFGACAVAIMLRTSALEQRSAWWVLIFALACAASSLYGWDAGHLAVWGRFRAYGHRSLCADGG